MAGAGGADGSRGGRGGGADGAGRGGNAGNSSGANSSSDNSTSSSNNASSAARASNAASVGAAAASVQSKMSEVAAAVKSMVSKAIDAVAPAGSFANSALGQLATALGVPSALVESRIMDVAYAALSATNPSFAMVSGLAAVGQLSVASALGTGISTLAQQHGLPGFAAKALGELATQQLQANVPGTGVEVARAVRAHLNVALDKASQNMGLDFARQVAARVESAVPGATRGLTRAGAAVWRDALDASAQQVFGKATSYLSDAVPALYGNERLSALSKALATGASPASTAEQELAMRNPNAYIEQQLDRYVIQLRRQMQQALA